MYVCVRYVEYRMYVRPYMSALIGSAACLPACLALCLTTYLPACLPASLPPCLLACLSTCLLACLSVGPSPSYSTILSLLTWTL